VSSRMIGKMPMIVYAIGTKWKRFLVETNGVSMMYCVKLYRHIYVYIRLMLCGCYAPNDTAVLIWKECCVAATHTMILPVRKIHGHSITWKTTWCEKYEVRKVELSVTVVILTKLILSDTKTFILICTFTVLISKK